MSDTGHSGGGVSSGAPEGALQRAGHGLQRFSDSYGLVFLLIVATLLTTALLGDVRWGRFVTAVLMGVTLLLTFRASRVPGQRSGKVGALVVVVLLTMAAIAAALGDAELSQLVALSIAALFVIAASGATVRRLRYQTSVSMRTVMGALCVYLFIGLFFAVVYSAVDIADDGGFFAQTDAPDMVDFVYFSFITQATVGYGDLSPITDLGRMLAITEALLGQVYLVTIVAALVSNLGRTRSAAGIAARRLGGDVGPAGPEAPVGASEPVRPSEPNGDGL